MSFEIPTEGRKISSDSVRALLSPGDNLPCLFGGRGVLDFEFIGILKFCVKGKMLVKKKKVGWVFSIVILFLMRF
jgi:hypothetical protein